MIEKIENKFQIKMKQELYYYLNVSVKQNFDVRSLRKKLKLMNIE